MDQLIEFGLFVGKTLIIVFGIIAVILTMASVALRSKAQVANISVTNLNEKLKKYSNELKNNILNKKELKKEHKKQKKEEAEAEKESKPKIYVINFEGDIQASGVDNLREEVTAILSVAEKGTEVVACIESPGGVVHGYGLAASQLQRIKDAGLKLTICVDKVAASGGYMMACTGHKIIAAPFAILGSIGVLAQVPNLHRFLKKHDVDYEEITAGEYKRTVSFFGEITPQGKEKFKDQMEDTHKLFKEFVSSNRPQVELSQVATGEYWFGHRALELKLVDELKTSDQYLMELSKDNQIYQVTKEKKKSFSEKVAENMSLALNLAFAKVLTQFKKNTLS